MKILIKDIVDKYITGLKEYLRSFFESIGLNNYQFKDIKKFISDWDINFELYIETISIDWNVTLQLRKSENHENKLFGRIYIYAYEKFMGLTNFTYINSNLNISRPEDLKMILLEETIFEYQQTKNYPIKWWFGHEGIDFIGPEGYTHPNIDMINIILNYIQTKEYEDLSHTNDIYKLVILKIQHEEFSYSFALKLNNHIGWIFLPFFMGSPGTTRFYMKEIDSKVEEINKENPNSIKVITIYQSSLEINNFIKKYYSIGHSSDISSRNINSPKMLINDNKFWKSFIKHTINNSESQYWDCKEAFNFWNIPPKNKEAKRDNEIKACNNIISFENADGGVIFVGISNAQPRKIIGVKNIEEKINSLTDVLNKYSNNKSHLVKYKEFNYPEGKYSKKLLILIIQQSREVIEVKLNDTDYRIPLRLGAKTVYRNYKDFKSRAYMIKENNIEFIREMYHLLNL